MIGPLTSSIHRGATSESLEHFWLDKFDVASVSEVRNEVGPVSGVDVARVVRSGAWLGP